MKPILYKMLGFLTACTLPLTTLASPDMVTQAAAAASGGNRIYGKVVQRMDVNNYTYVQIDTGEQTHWVAGPKTPLQKGAMIAIEANLPFRDFESKALGKTFKTIYFVNHFITDQPDQPLAVMDPHANLEKSRKLKVINIKGIKKAEAGKTIAEIFRQKQSLAGKPVRVRGQVVKYTPRVMGKNWLHIQDSSGGQQLVVTTAQEVKQGDRVLVNGVVAIDRDLGFGYHYDIILEQASVEVE